MNRIKVILSLGIIVFLIYSCNKSGIDPENIFTKIYDDPNSDVTYYPIDIAQLPGNGFLILGATALDTTHTWVNPVIICTDDKGEIEWISNLDLPYVNPVSNLMEINGKYYFFCLDNLSLGTHLLTVDEVNQTATLVTSFIDLTYPLAASKTPDNGFILLSYNRFLKQSVISKISSSFNSVWQTSFNVVEDVEPFLLDHLIKTGKSIPFFTGTVGESSASYYYANGLYNYTLSMLFVNASTGQSAGVAQGFRYDGGAVSAVSLEGNNFAISRFNFGEHFILPSIAIDVNSITTLGDLGGSKLAEIAADSETRIKKITVEGKPTLVIAASTNNNQIVIYLYDIASLELISKRYLGFSNPVKIASVIQTTDEGLAVLAQTMVAGRFKRISLYKIPKEHLK